MKNVKKNSPQVIGLALAVLGILNTLPAQAASLNFEDPDSADSLLAPEACEENAVNLTSQGFFNSDHTQTLNLGPNLIANSSVASDSSPGLQLNSSLVAQVPLEDDCCAVGGPALCEVGGIPPTGGIAGGFPLPLLAALAPAAASHLCCWRNTDSNTNTNTDADADADTNS
ncbi:MAG: PEP-CTERM sorting domain-containing protein, partial [Acaryochloridaceae cyanobacterium CSU_5_19]|nr:PEP-CTERM sorting domain-containing protein [Acaryochloridaceae cyanobacterium CSU_5_19]